MIYTNKNSCIRETYKIFTEHCKIGDLDYQNSVTNANGFLL